MSDTTFSAGTVVTKEWLNDVNDVIYNENYIADGTGASDAFADISNHIVDKTTLYLKDGKTYFNSAAQHGLAVVDNLTVLGDFQTKLKATAQNWRVFNTDNETTRLERIALSGVVAEGNVTSTDDWAPLRFSGLKGGLMFGCEVDQSFFGITYSYSSYNDKVERRSTEIRSVGNLATGDGAGFEFFALKNSTGVGNIAYKDGTQAINHGFRITGYGTPQTAPGTNLATHGLALAGSSANNFGNGISQQKGVFATAYAAFALTDCTNGISFPVNNDTAADQSKGNAFAGVAIAAVTNGILSEKTEKQVVESFAIRDFGLRGLHHKVASSASTYGTGKYNRFSGLIADQQAGATGEGVLYEGSNSRLDLTIADLAATASNGMELAGDYNIVTLTGGGFANTASPFLLVSGNHNIVIIAADGIDRTFGEILISGSYNTIIVNMSTASSSDGRLVVTGDYNTLHGHCNLYTLSGTGNDYSNIYGGSTRGSINGTTDASGDITISHGMNTGHSSTGYSATAISSGTTARICNIHSKTGTTMKVRFFDAAGTALASTAVTGEWMAEIYG